MAVRTAAVAAPLALPPAAVLAAALAAGIFGLAAPAAVAGTIHVVPGDGNPIQAAVDASADGDTILVGAGTYSSSVVFSGRSNLKIRGVAGAVLDSSGIYMDGCERITVDGIEFVDATDTQNAIHATGCPRLTLKNLRIEGYDGAAILLEGCDGARVSKCTVMDGPDAGLRDVGSADLVVEKSVFTGNGGLAIDLSTGGEVGSARARVSKNTITAESGGIAAEGEALRVEGNTLTLATGDGIVIGAAAEITGALVQKNTVASSGFSFSGIDVRGTLSKVAKNSVSGPVFVGIFVRGNGNRIEKNVASGQVQCFNLSLDDLVVTGNLAMSPLDTGFIVQQGSGAEITKNRVLDGGDSNGFYVSQQDVLLTKNYVEDSYNAFALGFGPMTLVGNVAVGSINADLTTGAPATQFTLVRNRFDVVLFDVPVEPPPI